MRRTLLQIFILFLFLGTNCTPEKELAHKNTFSFSVNGIQYQIVSISTKSGEGTNYLARLNLSQTPFIIARDLDQNGTIDLITSDEILSLAEANLIYYEGINQAKAGGNYTERTSLRSFEIKEASSLYTIKTYYISEESVNNLFLIYNYETKTESIFLDFGADGKLESVEKGSISLPEGAELYTHILDEGIRLGRIDFEKGIYIVKEFQAFPIAKASYLKK